MSKKRGNGEGSIYYSPKLKRWVGQFTAGSKDNGSLNRKTVYAKTRKEVAEKIIEKQSEINNKTFVNKSDVIFIDLCKQLIDMQYKLNTISDATYNRKNNTMLQLKKTNIANMKIQNITISDINTCLASLINYSNSSIKKICGLIRNTLDRAILLKIIYNNPFNLNGAIIRPRSNKENKKIEALTIDEQNRLLNVLYKTNDEYKDIFIVALFTGMRIGEILSLKRHDIDLENNIIHIQRTLTRDIEDKYILGKRTKTYAGNRDIPINPCIREILLKHCFSEILFTHNGKIITPTTINTHCKKLCKDANIQVVIRKKRKNNQFVNLKSSTVNTHMLRHTFATRCIEAGMSAIVLQKLLGHKEIGTTLDTYTSVFNKFKTDEFSKVVEYFNKISI